MNLENLLKKAELSHKDLANLLGIGVSTTYWKSPPSWVFVLLEMYIENRDFREFRNYLRKII